MRTFARQKKTRDLELNDFQLTKTQLTNSEMIYCEVKILKSRYPVTVEESLKLKDSKKKLSDRPKGYVKSCDLDTCETCKYMEWGWEEDGKFEKITGGSKSQHIPFCLKMKEPFMINIDDYCDEYE